MGGAWADKTMTSWSWDEWHPATILDLADAQWKFWRSFEMTCNARHWTMINLYSLSVVEVPSYKRESITSISFHISSNQFQSFNYCIISVLLRLFCPHIMSCTDTIPSLQTRRPQCTNNGPQPFSFLFTTTHTISRLRGLSFPFQLHSLELQMHDAFAKLEDCHCCDFQFAIIHRRPIHLWSGPLPIATCQGQLEWGAAVGFFSEMQVMFGVYTFTNS